MPSFDLDFEDALDIIGEGDTDLSDAEIDELLFGGLTDDELAGFWYGRTPCVTCD